MKNFFLVVVSSVALIFFTMSVVRADAQDIVPEQSAFITACQSARGIAELGNFNMESCRRVSEVIEGNSAFVTVRVKISGQGVFFVTTALMKSAWGQQAIIVRPA